MAGERPNFKEGESILTRRASRRSLLKGIAGALILATITPSSGHAGGQDDQDGANPFAQTETSLIDDINAKNENLDESLALSFGQGIAWGIGDSILGRFLNRRGVRIGNTQKPLEQNPLLREVEKNALIQLTASWVAAPLAEELIFRAFPKNQWAQGQDMRWDVGITTSLLFALHHNITGSLTPPRIGIDLSRIHALAFPVGLFCWLKVKRGGYYHAVATHSGHNVGTAAHAIWQELHQ